MKLCKTISNIYEKEPRCVFLQSPVYVFGDIHGNLEVRISGLGAASVLTPREASVTRALWGERLGVRASHVHETGVHPFEDALWLLLYAPPSHPFVTPRRTCTSLRTTYGSWG